jgi:hypothetical protein
LSNPSVATARQKLSCILRSVNYVYHDERFVSQDQDQVYRTENYYLDLAEDLSITRSVAIQDKDAEREFFPVWIKGYEDCRLLFLRERWWCSATICDGNSRGMAQVSLLRLNSEHQIDDVKILASPAQDRHEKNWVPLVRDEELFFVYWSDPVTIFHCDTKTGKLEKFSEISPSFLLHHQRGGSQAIPIKDGWLYVTHEVVVSDQQKRFYLHRFISLDVHFRFRGVTDPFYFNAPGIEFCVGLTIHPQTGGLLVSYGQNDCSAFVASLHLPNVLAELKEV